jgi:hypothetical protein
MTKIVFKREYSLYRKSVKNAYNGGLESYRNALNKNAFLKRIYLDRNFVLPISMKIWAYKNKKGQCPYAISTEFDNVELI